MREAYLLHVMTEAKNGFKQNIKMILSHVNHSQWEVVLSLENFFFQNAIETAFLNLNTLYSWSCRPHVVKCSLSQQLVLKSQM